MKLKLKTGLVYLFAVMISFPALGADEIHYIGFNKFVADREEQEIFPILVGALGDHQVVFTSGPFSLTGETDENTLLSLSWLDAGRRATAPGIVVFRRSAWIF